MDDEERRCSPRVSDEETPIDYRLGRRITYPSLPYPTLQLAEANRFDLLTAAFTEFRPVQTSQSNWLQEPRDLRS